MTYPVAAPHASASSILRPFPDHAGAWPPGSLFAGAEDLARFLLFAIETPKLFEPQAEILGDRRKYGFGVILEGDDRAFHTGARLGFGSRFEIDRAAKRAIFVAGNRSGSLFSRTAAKWNPPVSRPMEPSEPVSAAVAEQLAGSYGNRGPIRRIWQREKADCK